MGKKAQEKDSKKVRIAFIGSGGIMNWHVDRLKRILAISRIGGCLIQPESDLRSRTSTGAPQRGQVGPPPSLTIRQYGQV